MERLRRRQFTPEFKAEAVRMAARSPDSLAKIARHLGLSGGTLRKWVIKAEYPPPGCGWRRRLGLRRAACRAGTAGPPRPRDPSPRSQRAVNPIALNNSSPRRASTAA